MDLLFWLIILKHLWGKKTVKIVFKFDGIFKQPIKLNTIKKKFDFPTRR